MAPVAASPRGLRVVTGASGAVDSASSSHSSGAAPFETTCGIISSSSSSSSSLISSSSWYEHSLHQQLFMNLLPSVSNMEKESGSKNCAKFLRISKLKIMSFASLVMLFNPCSYKSSHSQLFYVLFDTLNFSNVKDYLTITWTYCLDCSLTSQNNHFHSKSHFLRE